MASPYRADHVGSLLRPPELLEVKAQFAEGKVSEQQLHAAEDAAVLKALELQKSAGIDVVTYGEYRRVAWSAAATNALGGLVPVQGSPIRRIFADWRGPDAEELNQTMARGQAMVREAAKRAMAKLGSLQPYRVSAPVALEVGFKLTIDAERAAFVPGLSRSDAYSVKGAFKDMIEITKLLQVLTSLELP